MGWAREANPYASGDPYTQSGGDWWSHPEEEGFNVAALGQKWAAMASSGFFSPTAIAARLAAQQGAPMAGYGITFGTSGGLQPLRLTPQGTDLLGQLGGSAINLLGNWALSRAQTKAQNKALKQQIKLQRQLAAATPAMGGAVPTYMNLNPNLGSSAGGLGIGLPTAALPAWADIANWQTAPVDPGAVFGTTAPVPGAAPVAAGAGAMIVAGASALARAALPLAKRLAPYFGAAAALQLAEQLTSAGVPAIGPYTTASANRAIAYRGDLAACKRLRAAGKAIGYARATGVRRAVRRGRRC